MLRRFACLALAVWFVSNAVADVIHLTDGRTLRGEVTAYDNGVIRFSAAGNDDRVIALNLVDRIEFDRPAPTDETTLVIPPPPAYEEALRRQVEQARKRLDAGRGDSAAIVMYLDTALGEPPIPEGTAEYRCYRGGGYSGIQEVPVGTPWMRFETVRQRDDGVRRLVIDPGPPYAAINQGVTLIPGEVTNLGRIVLRRIRTDKTVGLSGYVRDSHQDPIEGVLVSAGARRTHTDADGFYRLDGFGLEEVNLTARKKGFVNGGSRLAIRDTNKTEIPIDISLFRPRRLKISYVIGTERSDSFEGPGVETGSIERIVDSPRIPLDETIHASKSFQRFAREAHLYLGVSEGRLTLSHSHGPIFYQQAEANVRFEDIRDAGDASMNAQRCPPLTEGAVIVMRGYSDESPHAVSPFCVKLLVEELSTETGEFGEQDYTPVGAE